jgi:hypothetical protein
MIDSATWLLWRLLPDTASEFSILGERKIAEV